ncbi:MAG: potassium transporter TrkH [Clostridia bacterium]|nr:potassium transporter TrkH [Clostridia bacterium]
MQQRSCDRRRALCYTGFDSFRPEVNPVQRKAPPIRRLRPAHILPVSFLFAILTGTVLLLLPVSSADGTGAPLTTALFTATTSVCVTGLTVVETAAYWSPFGKAVIFLLIQAGGLGIVSCFALLMLLLRRRFSLSDRALLQDAFNLDTRTGVIAFLRRVFRGTLIVEGAGAILYSLCFIPEYGLRRGILLSVFTAVSAFCNAGIDLFGADSLAPYAGSLPVLAVTMALIVLGGLGFVVWFDMSDSLRHARQHRYPLRRAVGRLGEHTRLVLRLTFILIFSGAVFFFLCEHRNPETLGSLPLPAQLWGALFESVTLRTAGFSAFSQGKLSAPSSLAACLLMFIGGSPAGTAGGVKTVTCFFVLQNALSYIRGQKETVVYRRRVPDELMRRSAAILTVSLLAVLVLTALLLLAAPLSAADAFFEIVSACATVGLSRGVTPQLTTAGRLIVILAMYLGRIGPISMAVFFIHPAGREQKITHAAGRFFVG